MEDQHVEYRYRSEASETVIVFVHGIHGSPLQFEHMIQKLNGAYSIENLLLPACEWCGRKVEHGALRISRQIDHAKHRIELRIDCRHVARSLGCIR